ncbi:MAG: hypothetical protein FD126_3694, partial [Elusimicrobia bacterium]
MHRFDLAAPLFQACRKQGFEGFEGWTPVGEFLARAEAVAALTPPRAKRTGSASITVHAGPWDDWSGPILEAVP